METYKINGQDGIPEITLDKEQNQFFFGGRSIPENAVSMYAPAIDWLCKYCKEPNETTEVSFCFEYINSSSMKQIAKILSLLESIKSTVKVYWHYNEEDSDNQMHGERLAKLVDFPFVLMPDASK